MVQRSWPPRPQPGHGPPGTTGVRYYRSAPPPPVVGWAAATVGDDVDDDDPLKLPRLWGTVMTSHGTMYICHL